MPPCDNRLHRDASERLNNGPRYEKKLSRTEGNAPSNVASRFRPEGVRAPAGACETPEGERSRALEEQTAPCTAFVDTGSYASLDVC